MKLRNNKGKAAGSGTVSNARRERYRKACEERDKFLETSTDLAKAKELQRANQKKPVGDGAASSMEVKDEKKREEIAPCQKEQEAAPCQKEQGSAPCQKEQAKVEGKREEAAPCQKEQTKKQQEVDVKVEEKKRDAPCQKEQTKKEGEAPAPCQKELGPSSSQVELEKKAGAGKGSKRSQQERKKGEISLSSSSSSSSSSSRPAQTKRPKAAAEASEATAQAPCQKGSPSRQWQWISDGHRWITKDQAQKRIAIDYYQTLIKGNGHKVHWQDKNALQRLKDKGYYLILLSYCGVERSEEIMTDLTDQDMLQYFDKIRFTWKKCGKQGKATYCRDNHIPFIFDDCKEIVDECSAMGIYCYRMNTRRYTHTAGHWWFHEAVTQFLIDQK